MILFGSWEEFLLYYRSRTYLRSVITEDVEAKLV